MANPIRFFNEKSVTIKRMVYSGTPKKSSLSTLATERGYLRPLDEVQSAANGFQFGQGFVLLVDLDTDIKQSDTVVIDSQDFNVVGVAKHDRLSLKHRRVLLTLPQA